MNVGGLCRLLRHMVDMIVEPDDMRPLIQMNCDRFKLDVAPPRFYIRCRERNECPPSHSINAISLAASFGAAAF